MNIKSIACFLLGLFAVLYSKSQTCEWLTVETAAHNKGLYVTAITTDNTNNAIIGGRAIDSITISTYTLKQGNFFIIKYDAQGSLKWVATPKMIAAYSCVFDVATDNNKNIYATGLFTGTVDFGNSVTISSGYNSSFIAKYDSNGIIQWAKSSGGILHQNTRVTTDANGNVLLGFSFNNAFTVGGSSVQLVSNGGSDIALLKYSNSGTFVSGTSIGGYNNDDFVSIGTDNTNAVYAFGFSSGTFDFGQQNLTDSGYVLLKLNPSLIPVNGKKTDINDKFLFYHGDMAVKGDGNLVVTHFVYDSVNYGNGIYLRSPWRYSQPSATTGIIYYDSTLTAKWARKNDTVASNGMHALPITVTIKNNNIYLGGTMSGISRFGSTVLSNTGTSYQFFISKIDALGNFLWSTINDDTTATSQLADVSVDNEGDVLITGNFYKSIKVFNTLKNGLASNANMPMPDLFTAKIFDFSINRGFVSAGPYCAGDSIKIPFVKRGYFITGNQFIAELSDSAGNFEGAEIELGRLTSTESGTVNGRVPLFNVATTNKYRIRIISTNPVVQSYYRFDSLRLLIYSKDTANAGSDTTLCSGQNIRLGTTGGSKWHWSPTSALLNPADSAKRQLVVKPAQSTQYRIIISDSSGCGATDTDYVMVNVRLYINTQITGDSTVCKGFAQYLRVVATGGNESKYWFRWKTVGSGTTLSAKDSVFVAPHSTTTYMAIVGDSCSDKIDTSYFTLYVNTVLTAVTSPDTVICKGKSSTLRVAGIGCDSQYYKYEWYKTGSPTMIGNTDTITVAPQTTTTYTVILSDTRSLLRDTAEIKVSVDNIFDVGVSPDTVICHGQTLNLEAFVSSCDTSQMEYVWDNGLGKGSSKTITPLSSTTYMVIGTNKFNGLSDTAKVIVTVTPPLKISVNADTTICFGENAQLYATASGGISSAYKILWTADNTPWTSNSFTETITPKTTTTYKAVLSDGCSANNDSAAITVTVRPTLDITVNADTTICVGQSAELRAIAKGGNVTSYKIHWYETGGSWTSTTYNNIVSPKVTTVYKAVLADNCTTPDDTATITVTVRLPLSVITAKDTTVCFGETVKLKAMAAGGNQPTYQFQWFDTAVGLISGSDTISVSPTATTRYKAVISDGCTTPNDSTSVTITVRPKLSLSIIAKDSICSNQTVLLTAAVSGGNIAARTLLWLADNSSWTSSQTQTTDTPKVTTTYTAKVTDNCSPAVSVSKQIIVLPAPKADFDFSPAQGCPPLNVVFADRSTNNDTIQNIWKVELTETTGVGDFSRTFIKQGVYSARLTVSNTLGCTDFVQKNNSITVFEKPTALFTVKPDITEVEEPVLLFNHSQNAVAYNWSFGDGTTLFKINREDIIHTYKDSGTFIVSLIAENDKGCKDTLSKQIKLFDKINCTIPSGFTPNNGDYLNDYFAPVCVGVKDYTLTIFNRWGQVVLQCENCAWDGTYDGQPVPEGVYMYLLQSEAYSRLKSSVYGTINVVR